LIIRGARCELRRGLPRGGQPFRGQRLASAGNRSDALRVYDELRTAGDAAEILPTMDGDKRVYVVRIRSLPSKAEAQALADQLHGRCGIDNPAVLD